MRYVRVSSCFRLIVIFLLTACSVAQVSVLTQHNDNGRTGQNLEEVELAPDTVSSGQFGRVFQFAVDGDGSDTNEWQSVFEIK